MQYIPTDLPQYWKLNNRSDFSDAVIQSNAVLLFSQDGQTITAKTHQGTFIVIGGSDSASFDFSATTLQASDALQGKSFYNSLGELVQGTIPTVSATLSANKVSIPKGYISDSQTLIVPQGGSITTQDNVVHVPVGYRSASDSISIALAETPYVSANTVHIYKGYIAASDSITIAQAGAATVSGNVVTVPVGYIASQREVIVTIPGSQQPISVLVSQNVIQNGEIRRISLLIDFFKLFYKKLSRISSSFLRPTISQFPPFHHSPFSDNSGQMSRQSCGRKSLRVTCPLVARSMATQ